VNAGFQEHWKAYTVEYTTGFVISGEDYHKRSNRFPREAEKEQMAEETFRKMVGMQPANWKYQTRW
jgi:hypothetical protein